MCLYVRPLTPQEARAVARLAASRTHPHGLVVRASIIHRSALGGRVPTIATVMGFSETCVRKWVSRFNREGMAGLRDREGRGRPRTYTEAERTAIVALARQGGWTLRTLTDTVNDLCILIGRSQVRRICRAARVDWRKGAQEGATA